MYPYKHLVIDGWNAIHSQSQLRRAFELESLDSARAKLMQIVAPIHDFGGVRITIVYDGKGEDISIVRPNSCLTFSEVFTPASLSADELIEQLCSTSKKPQDIMIVTRDNMLRLTATSFGAFSISPEELFTMSSSASANLAIATRGNNTANARVWKKLNPFESLDPLALELTQAVASPLISKRLKKKLKRANQAENSDAAISRAQKKSAKNP